MSNIGRNRCRKRKAVEDSEESNEVQENNFHYKTITIKKYDTYKNGNFKNKNLKLYCKNLELEHSEYLHISNYYSVRPKKKLCDFTGIPTMFKCPYTRLYYYDSSVYKYIQTLTSDVTKFIYLTRNICANNDPSTMK